MSRLSYKKANNTVLNSLRRNDVEGQVEFTSKVIERIGSPVINVSVKKGNFLVMYLNFPEFWRVGVVLGSVSGKGAIRLRNVWVRSWVAVFFLFNRKTLNSRSKLFFQVS